jgi:hypothetical protein
VDATGLYVADSYNSRVVFFPKSSTTATRVYGQPDFTSNAVGTSAKALLFPSGVALATGGIYIADNSNNRVVFYPTLGTTATRVYGQPNFTTRTEGTSATKLNAPQNVAVAADGIFVSDTVNNRVLFFAGTSTTATQVFGQPDFTSNAAGSSATALGNPWGIAVGATNRLYVVDWHNNRALIVTDPGDTKQHYVYMPAVKR